MSALSFRRMQAFCAFAKFVLLSVYQIQPVRYSWFQQDFWVWSRIGMWLKSTLRSNQIPEAKAKSLSALVLKHLHGCPLDIEWFE